MISEQHHNNVRTAFENICTDFRSKVQEFGTEWTSIDVTLHCVFSCTVDFPQFVWSPIPLSGWICQTVHQTIGKVQQGDSFSITDYQSQIWQFIAKSGFHHLIRIGMATFLCVGVMWIIHDDFSHLIQMIQHLIICVHWFYK